MANEKIKTEQDLPAGFSLIKASVGRQPAYERISEDGVTPLDFDLWGCWAAFELGFKADILTLHELQNNCDNCIAQALHMARMQELNPVYRRKNTNKRASPRPEDSAGRRRLQYCLDFNWWQFIPVCRPIGDTPPPPYFPHCCTCNRSGTASPFVPPGCNPDTLPDPRDCGPRPDGKTWDMNGNTAPSHWPYHWPGRNGMRGWGDEDPTGQYDWCAENKTGEELTACLKAVTDWNSCQEGNFKRQDDKDICIDEEKECKDAAEAAFEDCKKGREKIYYSLFRACMGNHMNNDGSMQNGDNTGAWEDIEEALPGIIEGDPQE